MITKEAREKRDVKRDFRGILAIKLRHSLPRHHHFTSSADSERSEELGKLFKERDL